MAKPTEDLIRTTVQRFQGELPALANLKLTFELDLRGRGDVQIFQVELPGPTITKTLGDQAPIKVTIPRSEFNKLAEDGQVKAYRKAYEEGQIKVEGDEQIQKLIAMVIEKHEERARTKKAH